MVSACVNGCAAVISWMPGWHEWHGECPECRGHFVYADETVEDRDKAVVLLPPGEVWTRVVKAADVG